MRYSDRATRTIVMTVRTTTRVLNVWTWTGAPAGGGGPAALPALSALGRHAPAPGSDRAEDLPPQRGHAEQPGARMGADHRPHLGHELRRPAEHLLAAPRHLLRLVERLDVLDEEDVVAVLAQRGEVVDQSLEGAAPGAHSLHGHHLVLDREDRLDAQGGPDPGLRAADPPTAAQ